MTREQYRRPSDKPPDRPMLVWQRSSGAPVEFEIGRQGVFSIGRDPACAITIDAAIISKTHAQVRFADGEYLIEDLKSANGTKVNGQAVAVSSLKPGDVIELGDERVQFVDRARPEKAAVRVGPSGGRSKALRLALVAVISAIVMIAILKTLLPKQVPAATVDAAAPPSAAVGSAPLIGDSPSGPPGTPPVLTGSAPSGMHSQSISPATETPIVRETVTRAREAGVSEVDALFDEAVAERAAGRFRHAGQLFSAVVARDHAHTRAQNRLAETRLELERALALHQAEGERAFAQLRFDDARLQWEQVLDLAEPTDPRYAAAQAALAQSRVKLAR